MADASAAAAAAAVCMDGRAALVALVRAHVAPEAYAGAAAAAVDVTLRVLGRRTAEARVRRRIDRELVAVATEHCLSKFSSAVFQQQARRAVFESGAAGARLRAWLFQRINGGAHRRCNAGTVYSPWQMRCPILIPGLEARPFWDPAQFPWAAELRRLAPQIRAELLALQDTAADGGGFQPYRAPSWTKSAAKREQQQQQQQHARPPLRNSQQQPAVPAPAAAAAAVGAKAHDRGSWNVFYLFLHNVDFAEHRTMCPVTTNFIESALGGRHYSHAFFSAMASGTHITKHNGPTNKKLRVHLPLIVPEGGSRSKLRVGDETRHWREGEVLIFDDSFEHEAWNDAAAPRVVLIFDVWHPAFSPQEVKLLDFLTKAHMRAEKKAVAAAAAATAAEATTTQTPASADAAVVLAGAQQAAGGGSGSGHSQEVLNVLRGDNLYSIIEQTRGAAVDAAEIWG